MIPIDCKIFKKNPYTYLLTFFGNSYNFRELTSATSKEKKMITKIIFVGATTTN